MNFETFASRTRLSKETSKQLRKPRTSLARWMLYLPIPLVAGCAIDGRETAVPATTYVSYCAIATPIYVSVRDSFTEETAKAILKHNETWSAICEAKK